VLTNDKQIQKYLDKERRLAYYVRRYWLSLKKNAVYQAYPHILKNMKSSTHRAKQNKTQCYIAVILPVDKASKAETEHLKQQQN